MKLIIILSTLVFSASSFAGISLPVAQELAVCNGADVSIGAHFVAGFDPKSATEVANTHEVNMRIYNKDLIAKLKTNYVVAATNWDKTLWYKGLGIDINDVSDYITFFFRNGSVDFVGGGNTHYENQRTLVNGKNLGNLPKTDVSQADRYYHNITLDADASGNIQVVVSLVTAAVQKCVKTKVVPNPYHHGDPSSPEMITVCDQHEEVKPLSIIEEYAFKTTVDPKCAVGALPN